MLVHLQNIYLEQKAKLRKTSHQMITYPWIVNLTSTQLSRQTNFIKLHEF